MSLSNLVLIGLGSILAFSLIRKNTATDAIKSNSDTFIQQMHELIAQTASDACERTFSFCSKDGIKTTPTNIGDEHEVYLRECTEGEKLGDYHTHTNTTQFSVADVINLVSRQNSFSCIGAAAENKISCLEVIPTEEGFEQWQQRLYAAAEEPLSLREELVHSDIKAHQWLDVYRQYESAIAEFDSIVKEGKERGYLKDSTVELLQELSNS